MPRNFLDLNLDFDEIRERIAQDKGKLTIREWADRLQVSPSLIAQIHPKVIKPATKKPSIAYIIAVALQTGKPIEWYLYGKEGPPPIRKVLGAETRLNRRPYHPLMKDLNFWKNWSDEAIEACDKTKRIIDSNHPIVKPLMLQGLDAFIKQLDHEKNFRRPKA
jgi:hypothetical protein